MTKSDTFGFSSINDEETGLDLSAFAPKPKPVDRQAAEIARDTARGEGFQRRATVGATATPERAASTAKRRVKMTDAMGVVDRYAVTERVQINCLAPVPVAKRWKDIVGHDPRQAWEILEEMLDLYQHKKGLSPAPNG